MFRLDSGFLPCFEEALETFVLETLDHATKCNPLRYTSQSFLQTTLYSPAAGNIVLSNRSLLPHFNAHLQSPIMALAPLVTGAA
jgi:hypothetical protein